MGRVTESTRHHADRCPGVLRPWIADDGALVRIRLVGGAISSQALSDLAVIAGDYADGHLYLTKRANIQLRGIKHVDGSVPEEFVDAISGCGPPAVPVARAGAQHHGVAAERTRSGARPICGRWRIGSTICSATTRRSRTSPGASCSSSTTVAATSSTAASTSA